MTVAATIASVADSSADDVFDSAAGNNSDAVPGGTPEGMISDILEVETIVHAETETMHAGHALLQRSTPNNTMEAECALRVLDSESIWGQKSFVSRFARLARRQKYSAALAGWEWVDDIVRTYSTAFQVLEI